MTTKQLQTPLSLLDKLIRRNIISGVYPESDLYRTKVRAALQPKPTVKPCTVYAGFDATASSLHVGNLAILMNLLHFHRHGHQVICLVGDATTRIGDPSGHLQDRKVISAQNIEQNAKAITEVIERVFDNQLACFPIDESSHCYGQPRLKPILVRNSQWYKGTEVVDFVSDVFRHMRVGSLLHKQSIKERLSGTGLSVSEFCYQIFQAYDWLELYKRYNCNYQVGGFDQSGNIYSGHELIKKVTGSTEAVGLLVPLLTTKSGKKLGKSTSGMQQGIWLTSHLTDPYELYQFFHRTPDSDVEKLFKTFTFDDVDWIENFIRENLNQRDDIWRCQRELAKRICRLVHGEEGLRYAEIKTSEIYENTGKIKRPM